MGRAPDGKAMPNGTDFWWDRFPGNTGNCWWQNEGPAPITTSPSPLPDCDSGQNPSESVGTGFLQNEAELASCLAAFETRNYDRESTSCPWLFTPPKPGSSGAIEEDSPEGQQRQLELFLRYCTENPNSHTCKAYLPARR
jgi:hypothetical protein